LRRLDGNGSLIWICALLGGTATSTWSLGGKLLSLVVLIAFSDAFAFQPIWSVFFSTVCWEQDTMQRALGMLVEAHRLQ
jgi:hypothetical protein